MGAWIEEPLYSAVPVEDIHETVDGRHVFWLDDLDDGRIRVVWDGLAGEPLGGLEPFQDGTRLAASRNGRHLCYYAGGNGQIRIGLDDTLGPPFDSVTRSVPPSVSDVTGRLAYGAYLDGVPRLIVDHARDPRSTAPLAPYPVVWSPDGTRLA